MGAWSDFLKQTISGPPSANNATVANRRGRIPFKFTSDLSLSSSGEGTITTALASDVAAQTNTVATTGTAGTTNTDITELQDSASSPDTFGMVKMAINPQSIRWQQAKRFTKRDTMAGSTYMHFLNNKLQDNDMLRLEFHGTTGNIALSASSLPTRPIGNPQDTNGYEKLVRFHQLWNLTRQAKLFWDGHKNIYVENHQYIIYETQIVPFPIILTGLYDKVLEFEESAEKPNQARYSFSFIVTDASPDIDDIARYLWRAQVP
jgi:hypothetical protein